MSKRITLRLMWDDNKAEEFYVLLKISTMNQYWEEEIARGDFDWAVKTAEHYGISMPKKES